MKKYYDTHRISILKNNKWVHGRDALKHMKCIKSNSGNWDLYLDENRGWVYYVSTNPSCHSGFWGTVKQYEKKYGSVTSENGF